MERKTVWISGAANGIGRAAAIRFCSEGYYVGLADINKQDLDKLQAELGEENAKSIICDVSDQDSVKNAVEVFTQETGGRLDVLLVNAGILSVSSFEGTPLEKYKKMIEINAFGYVNQIYNALPALKETNGSHVILISSSSAICGIPLYAVYSATKAFVKSLTESLQIELKDYGVTVNSVWPHMVKTAMQKTQVEGGRRAGEFRVTSEMTADVIWKAANKPKKLFWIMGRGMGFNFLMKRILPTALMQRLVKKLHFDPFV